MVERQLGGKEFERIPVQNFVDLTKDNDPIPNNEAEDEAEDGRDEERGPLPSRRVVRKTANYATDLPPPPGLVPPPEAPDEPGPFDRPDEPMGEPSDQVVAPEASGPVLPEQDDSNRDNTAGAPLAEDPSGGTKREPAELEEPPKDTERSSHALGKSATQGGQSEGFRRT